MILDLEESIGSNTDNSPLGLEWGPIDVDPRLYEVEEGSEGQKQSSFCHLACGLGKYLFIKVD